ncbi:hypothetical protein Mpop_2662 [Methylorubrum populi BJ001]|jgi:uncharacterized membrane protein YagU involved in acid resistance|uniref:Uncharacterized protein n=1 Tax=Methylorubrum populi (strain ATCC BAA-705 / NCIMB 13946 / BJ001) TaxID=441620 RepID=B1ZCC6_METPB|nr:hypothetical protein [Methylorubrum populi]ACB80819.1 hypothetical protein Mpop_2662 [Methylorubrum populi BJ001]
MDWIDDLLGLDRYQRAATCLGGDSVLQALYVGFSAVGIISCFIIVWALIFRVRAGHQLQISLSAGRLYGGLIGLTGFMMLSHTMMIFTPLYRLDVLSVVVWAMVAAVTAMFTVAALFDLLD